MTEHLNLTQSVVAVGEKKRKIKQILNLLLLLIGYGVSGVDPTYEESVFVTEGDSITLRQIMKINQQEDQQWYFNRIPIAKIIGYQSKICADGRCDTNKFKNRLKLDQTGSLAITNTKPTDSGLYDVLVSGKVPGGGGYNSVVACGISSVDKDEVSVMEEDSVTLHTGVKTNQQEKIKWYFNGTRIAQFSVDQRKICTDVQCKDGDERFRGRLKLDTQTGSLTIKKIRTSDAGLYNLQIINNRISIMKIFSVTVASSSGVGTDVVAASVMEGDSVMLNSNVKTNQQEKITWFFKNIHIAEITGDLNRTCTDVQCNEGTERFRDRLQLDHQTGSLTITNTRTSDSGLYHLKIISNRASIIKTFNVVVNGVSAAKQEKEMRKLLKEGESVTFDPDEIKSGEAKRDAALTWYFNEILIAEITGDQSKICTDDECKDIFRDRLKLNQIGSLTIINMRTSESGLYKLMITNIRFSTIKSFIVTVTAAVKRIYAAGVVVLLLVALAAAVIYQYRRRETVMQSSHQNCAEEISPYQNEDQGINETSNLPAVWTHEESLL